jgi:cell shape-determining protein MreC
MTDKELRKLKRTELLELMLYLRQELDSVKQENEELRKQLESSKESGGKADEKFYSVLNEISDKIDMMYRANIESKDVETASKYAETEK